MEREEDWLKKKRNEAGANWGKSRGSRSSKHHQVQRKEIMNRTLNLAVVDIREHTAHLHVQKKVWQFRNEDGSATELQKNILEDKTNYGNRISQFGREGRDECLK